MISSELIYAFLSVAGLAISALTVLIAYRFFRLYERRTEIELRLREREFFANYPPARSVAEREVRRLQTEITDTVEEFSDVNHLIIDGQKRLSALSLKLVDPSAFLRELRIDVSELSLDKGLIFVLTPFDDISRPLMEAIIAAFDGTGMRVLRGDETRISGEILPHIVEHILRSRLIIANIEGRNPNVMYELGIANALGKDVITVSGMASFDQSDVPFDLRSRQIILYKSRDEFIAKLRSDVIQRFFSS